MIALLVGTLAAKEADRVVIRTAAGVGYECQVPTRLLADLPRVGQPVELYTHLLVREDAQTLFGFGTPEERRVFQRLLGASGVGPRLALAMLSSFPAARLVKGIREKDVAALVSVPGVGKKTAERLILELADKTGDLIAEAGAPAPAAAEAATSALVRLGYSHAEADDAVRRTLARDGERATQDVIREALSLLAGR